MQPETPDIHLPGPSFWPIVMASGVVLIAIGVLLTLVISGLGVMVVLASIAGWTQENRLHAPPDEVEPDAEEEAGMEAEEEAEHV